MNEEVKQNILDFLLVVSLMIGAGGFGAFLALALDPDCKEVSQIHYLD